MATTVASEECGWHPRRDCLPVATELDWVETPFPPYSWVPVQIREHEGFNADQSYFVGAYVDSLSVDMALNCQDSRPLQLEERFQAPQRQQPSCLLVGQSLVMCRGVAVGYCPREPDSTGRHRNLRIARLPRGFRPRQSLQFAALLREVHCTESNGRASCSSHLVTLVVTPDGWILGLASHASTPPRGGSEGAALNLAQRGLIGAIDLSAIRFSLEGGISLVDEVRLNEVDVAGTRIVILQGFISLKRFTTERQKALAILPDSCRPARPLWFVVPGGRAGGFHLVAANPTKSFGVGCGAELLWRDSIWNRDEIHLSGLMFEVSSHALKHSLIESQWSSHSAKIFLDDFQRLLRRRFGSIEAAWYEAFDTDGSGSINFTEFGLGCKAAGFVGNVMKLWAALDTDRSGDISLEELDQEVVLDTVEAA